MLKFDVGKTNMIMMDFEDINRNYNDVVKKCKESGKPIYLTNNGQSKLVVMDIASFKKREQELLAQQLVIESYAARLTKEKDYSLEESKDIISELINSK